MIDFEDQKFWGAIGTITKEDFFVYANQGPDKLPPSWDVINNLWEAWYVSTRIAHYIGLGFSGVERYLKIEGLDVREDPPQIHDKHSELSGEMVVLALNADCPNAKIAFLFTVNVPQFSSFTNHLSAELESADDGRLEYIKEVSENIHRLIAPIHVIYKIAPPLLSELSALLLRARALNATDAKPNPIVRIRNAIGGAAVALTYRDLDSLKTKEAGNEN